MRLQLKDWMILAALGYMGLSTWEALAAGKKPQVPPSCGGGGALSTPIPARRVQLPATGGVFRFELPNGSVVDPEEFRQVLDGILGTEVAKMAQLQVLDPTVGLGEPCVTRLELRARVTAVKLDVGSVGVSFGYTPSGSISVLKQIGGKVNVRVGMATMEFAIARCDQNAHGEARCVTLPAANATQATAGVNLDVAMDFDSQTGITSAATLVYNTRLEDVFRAVMRDGLKKLVGNTEFNQLPWSARVTYVVPGALFGIDAGLVDQLGADQRLIVMGEVPSTSSCPASRSIAYGHTSRVDGNVSTAVVDELVDPSRDVRVDDVVTVNLAGSQ